ncbi:MAG: hypothetical protein HY726_00700, partial [Candidatus Rokubacteria bacterium]|nr:hypothetical protein [Candidatus Rokubacteria bacterium]
PEFYRYYSPRYGSSLAHDPAYYPYYRHLYSSSLAADPAYYRYFQDRYLGPPAGPLGRNEP